MLRRLWQSAMIGLARSSSLKGWIQKNRTAAAMMQRYVAGGTAKDAVATARDLAAKGISVSLFYLGEYVETREGIDEAVREKLSAIKALSEAGLDIHVSVDPTQIGLGVSSDLMTENARVIGKALANAARGPGRHCLMLDMEDHTTVDATLALHDDLAADGVPVAVTMQAYLKRTEADLAARIRPGGMVRLVKGAFVAGPEIAHVGNAAIKENSRRLIDLMLSEKARDRGFYPVIATHDDRLQAYAIERAEANGWALDAYEFEMLFGVRTKLAETLAASGHRIRLYTPFGRDWWPYGIRRIGENPASLPLLVRSVVSG
ncbi:proline dehydrogenase family protein [Rhodobium gokarnense]|uniref:Proline dehydrogenase n=1 Tax=Rhodobium gokarnense TaxID=364296 RepID=A0ABT3HG15_9HYPH|nr:proline dehydrogenase family protein [Rhodobium gokarnense]MCW2309338.1 proline dehydrogenase [Rhodobium gokarnense]